MAEVLRPLLCLLGSAPLLSAQGLRPVRALAPGELKQVGVRLERHEGRVRALHWASAQLILPRPTKDCELGRIAGSKDLIALVGGITDDLELYVLGADGTHLHYGTAGGRQLGRGFAGGRGSWPLFEGRHLLIFAFRRGGQVELRALDYEGRVLASRSLAGSLTGFRAESDADAGQVKIRFGAGSEPWEFRHPLAPRLSYLGLLEFGEVEVGTRRSRLLNLANEGKRPLRIRIRKPAADFVISGALERKLAPGARIWIAVEFRPTKAGAVDRSLQIEASGPVPRHDVVLRAVAKNRRIDPVPRQPRPGAAPGATPAGVRAPVPLAPRIEALECHPLGGDLLLVRGRLTRGDSAQLRLGEAQGEGVAPEIRGQGRFALRIRAKAGARLQAWSDAGQGRLSPRVALARVPAMLKVSGDRAELRLQPGQEFALRIASAGDRSTLRWLRARADGRGRWRSAAAPWGTGPGPALRLELWLLGGERPMRAAVVGIQARARRGR